jgi:serine/threonine-protein kinase RsbW
MQGTQNGSANGNASLVKSRASASVERDDLRATCRRQARVIDGLAGAVLTLRTGATALKAENAELRAEIERLHGRGRERRKAASHEEPVEVCLALDVQAPAAARAAVAGALRDRVPAAVLDRAQLLISELATNSVVHSAAMPADDLILRVQPSETMVRLEIEDSGRGDVIVARPPDFNGTGGFGLNLVHTLSERWGVEHAVAGGTRVWAQLSLTAVDHAVPAVAAVITSLCDTWGRPNGGSRGEPSTQADRNGS